MSDTETAAARRAEMAAARARIATNLDAIEMRVWQGAETLTGTSPDAHRPGAFRDLVGMIMFAERRGWIRALWRRWHRT